MDVPAIRCGLMPRSSKACRAWICAMPRAPPPPRASPIRGLPLCRGWSPVMGATASSMSAVSAVVLTDRDDGRVGRQEFFRHRLHAFGVDRIDQAFALVDVVDTQAVELDAHQRRGDGE